MKMRITGPTIGLAQRCLGLELVRRQRRPVIFRTVDHLPVPDGYPTSAAPIAWTDAAEETPVVEPAPAASRPRLSLDDVRRALAQSSAQAPSASPAAQSAPETGPAARPLTPSRQVSSSSSTVVQSKLVERDARSETDIAARVTPTPVTPPPIAEADVPAGAAEKVTSAHVSRVNTAAQLSPGSQQPAAARRSSNTVERQPATARNAAASNVTRRPTPRFTALRTNQAAPVMRQAPRPEPAADVPVEVEPGPDVQLSITSGVSGSQNMNEAQGATAAQAVVPGSLHFDRAVFDRVAAAPTPTPGAVTRRLQAKPDRVVTQTTPDNTTPIMASRHVTSRKAEAATERFAADEQTRTAAQMAPHSTTPIAASRPVTFLQARAPTGRFATAERSPGGPTPARLVIQAVSAQSPCAQSLDRAAPRPVRSVGAFSAAPEEAPAPTELQRIAPGAHRAAKAIPDQSSSCLQLRVLEGRPNDKAPERIPDGGPLPAMTQMMAMPAGSGAVEPEPASRHPASPARTALPRAAHEYRATGSKPAAAGEVSAAVMTATQPQAVQRSVFDSFSRGTEQVASGLAGLGSAAKGVAQIGGELSSEERKAEPQMDIQAIAQEVCHILRRQIRVEKERSGGK